MEPESCSYQFRTWRGILQPDGWLPSWMIGRHRRLTAFFFIIRAAVSRVPR